MLYAVIMAGGSGTRFWPQSTRENPKQFLHLFGDRSMLQLTVDRVKSQIPSERILIVTNERYVQLVKDQLPDLPAENIIGEPVARNTAPCVALAAGLLQQRDESATMVVLPADHYIGDEDQFLSVLETAATKAQDDCLVTIGITPTRPETGYGYIEYKEDTSETISNNKVNRVTQFTEKPDERTATDFIVSGNYLWNSGMFIWRASTIIEAFEDYQPDIHTQIIKIDSPSASSDLLETFYKNCPAISIDYGIMEHADSVFVVHGTFGWNDVGSWTALYEMRPKDEQGNVVHAGPVLFEESRNNLIQSRSNKLIALVGIENTALVETGDAILVCRLDKAQEVRTIVDSLKASDRLKGFL